MTSEETNHNLAEAEKFKDLGNDFFQKSHDFQKAIAAYTSAITLANDKFIYYNNRAAAYLSTREYVKAISDCDASLSIQPNVRAFSRKAAALGELGNVEEALAEVAMGLTLAPSDMASLNVQTGLRQMKAQAEKYKEQGNDHVQVGHDYAKAVKSYTAAIAIINNNYIYYNNRAAAYIFAGEYTKAIEDCDRSLALVENVRAYSRKATALGEAGMVTNALAVITQALAMAPTDAQSLNVKSGLNAMVAQVERLQQRGKEQLNASPPNLRAAIKSFSEAISIASDDHNMFALRGGALLAASSLPAALRDCQASLALKQTVGVHVLMAMALGDLGRFDEALVAVERGLDMDPDDKKGLEVESRLQVMIAMEEDRREQLGAEGQGQEQGQGQGHVAAGEKGAQGGRGRGLFAGLQHLGDRVKAHIHHPQQGRQDDYPLRCAQEDARLSQQQNHSRRFRVKLRDVREAREVVRRDRVCVLDAASLLVAQAHARTTRQARQAERRYLQRVSEEDTCVIARLRQERVARRARQGAREMHEERSVLAWQQHAREVRRWKAEAARMALEACEAREKRRADPVLRAARRVARRAAEGKGKCCPRRGASTAASVAVAVSSALGVAVGAVSPNEQSPPRPRPPEVDSAKTIREAIVRRRVEAGQVPHHHPPMIPEHLLPLDQKVALWREQIKKTLRRDWIGMTFTVEYEGEEGLCIGFDINDEAAMEADNVDYKIARYMNKLAVSGILHEKRLHKRADRWRVLQDARGGRHMSLDFYCHIPRTVEAHMLMPRITGTDIIRRDVGLYDYDLVPRGSVVKKIAQNAYNRDIRPPCVVKNRGEMMSKKMRKRGAVPDTMEYVELPSVQVEMLCPGFVHMAELRPPSPHMSRTSPTTSNTCNNNNNNNNNLVKKGSVKARPRLT